MLKKRITDYFLDKPGTFESDESNDAISLNLASKEVAIIKEGETLAIEFRMPHGSVAELKKQFTEIETLSNDDYFDLCSLKLDVKVNQEELFDLIDLSYESVLSTLPEQEKEEILDLEW